MAVVNTSLLLLCKFTCPLPILAQTTTIVIEDGVEIRLLNIQTMDMAMIVLGVIKGGHHIRADAVVMAVETME